MAKPEKVQQVAEMTELFKSAQAYFVTDYQGLNVEDMTILRRELRGSQVKYLIAKNTLIKLAARDAGVKSFDEHLKGPTAIAFVMADPVPAAKVLNESFKKRERPRMKAFVMENELFAGEQIGRLADLPSREVLLAQVVAAVEAPFTSLVGSIDGFFRQLVGSIDALADKRRAEG